jgi:hypothetical protein
MATSTTLNGGPAIDAAFEQFKDSGEQFVTAARKAGQMYLDSYEKAVDRAVELELRVAQATPQDWLKELFETQARLTKDLTASYTSTARGLLKS